MLTEEQRRKLSEAMKGNKNNPGTTGFKKGHIPWNKNKIGVFSESTLKRKSESMKGKLAGPKHPLYGRRGVNAVRYGKKHTSETIAKISSENHYNWKGDEVGYKSLHSWIRKRLPKPSLCVDCKKVPPYDLANISDDYLRDIRDWEWLCRRCHMTKDGRFDKFINSSLYQP